MSGAGSYLCVKDAIEKFFAATAAASHWAAVFANPADIIGPILSPHQAAITWQAKIGGMLLGNPVRISSFNAVQGCFPWIPGLNSCR
jgi:hypothetical protein